MLRHSTRWISLVILLGPAAAAGEPEIRLTPQEAVRRALQYNWSLKADRLDPALSTAAERSAAAAFEPELFGETALSGAPEGAGSSDYSTSVSGDVGARKLFSVGTSVEARLSSSASFGGGTRGGLDPSYQSGLTLSARQSLLQGISRRSNEAPITSARLSREAARHLLNRRAELLAAETLRAYWDLRAAMAKVKIQELSLQTAQQTQRETEELIAAGKLPASEQASASYAVKSQLRNKVQTEQELANVRDRMARLIGLVAPESLATPLIIPVSAPRRNQQRPDMAELQKQAMSCRGDYRALQLQGEIERTAELVARHRLLPALDLVASLGITGLSGEPETGTTLSEERGHGYWSSFAMDRLGWAAGLVLEVPLGNAAARAQRDIAGLRVKRAEADVKAALQDLSLELNLAWRAVQAARDQLRLTEEAARVAEAKLANETARYKAGKITAHILSAVQAEVTSERLAREQELADLVKAAVDLQASAGVLLARMGLRPDGTSPPGAVSSSQEGAAR